MSSAARLVQGEQGRRSRSRSRSLIVIPRVFHLRCVQLESSPAEDWVCPECVLVMSAENLETRSRAMRLLSLEQLCTLLKHALARWVEAGELTRG